jgi:hypothetical protein
MQPTGKAVYAAGYDYKNSGWPFVLDGYGGHAVNRDGSDKSPWKSPAHMPEKFSRYTVAIASVKVEQRGGKWFWIIDIKRSSRRMEERAGK